MRSIITVLALDPAIDRTLLIPGFAAGVTNRVVSARVDAGGQGVNVARVLKALGADVRVLGFPGDGNGRLIANDLTGQAIANDLLPVPGEARVNLKIIDPETSLAVALGLALGTTVARVCGGRPLTPHGCIFVLPIPNVVTALVVNLLKPAKI